MGSWDPAGTTMKWVVEASLTANLIPNVTPPSLGTCAYTDASLIAIAGAVENSGGVMSVVRNGSFFTLWAAIRLFSTSWATTYSS